MTRELVSEMQLLKDDIDQLYARMAALFQRAIPVLEKNQVEADVADIGFLSRQMSMTFEECEKHSNAMQSLLAKIIGMMVVKRTANDPTVEPRLRGELATASPDIKMIPCLPSSSDPRYKEIAKSLGISEEALDKNLVKINFRSLSDYATELVAQGKPGIPDLRLTQEFTCRYTKLKKGKSDG